MPFFLSFLLWTAPAVHSEKADAFNFFFYSFLILNVFNLIIRLSWHGSRVWRVNPVDLDFFFFFFIGFFSFYRFFFSLLFSF